MTKSRTFDFTCERQELDDWARTGIIRGTKLGTIRRFGKSLLVCGVVDVTQLDSGKHKCRVKYRKPMRAEIYIMERDGSAVRTPHSAWYKTHLHIPLSRMYPRGPIF